MAAAGLKTSGPIAVPGAWQQQGFGEETSTMRHQFIGVGEYSRSVSLPQNFTTASRSLWLVVERIERSAKLIGTDGKVLAEHTGYLSKMEADVTSLLQQDPAQRIGSEARSK